MSFRHRFVMLVAAFGVIGAVLVGISSTILVRSAVRDRATERIRAETALLAVWTGARELGQPQLFAVDAAAQLGVRVTLIDPSGRVIGDSSRGAEALAEMDNHADRPEIIAARNQGQGESERTSATTGESYFYLARRLEENAGFVRIALPTSVLEQAESRYTLIILAVLLGSVVLMTTVAYAVVRRFTKPVEWMAGAVERASAGDFNVEAPPNSPDEVVRLVGAVQRMKRLLLARLAELDDQRALLASVVSGMQEGLLLLGPDNRAQLVNDSLVRILDLRFDPVGHRLSEIVREPALIDEVERLVNGEEPGEEAALHIGGLGKTFEVHVTPLGGSVDDLLQGVLVLLIDVTRTETLEHVRREFVANVSHELRTPLTSIKASVETLPSLGSDEKEAADRFFDIIRRNVDHMGELVEDLTNLSLIETGSIDLDPSELDLTEVAREVSDRVRPMASERSIAIGIESPSPLNIVADRRRLEQILTNLLDNAIKYSRDGGKILIRGELQQGRPRLTVEDNGIGIATEHQEKVFNRLFQVARDRSTQRPGTGLGLAIVKHLMRLHGGTVSLESELGEGSRFLLEFPEGSPPSSS